MADGRATDEIQLAFLNAKAASELGESTAYVDGLKAVIDIVERDLRAQIADVIDSQARLLRGAPFRSGEVGIEYIGGIEAAGAYVETGEWS